MCIIIAKKKFEKVEPYYLRKAIENSLIYNQDGYGYTIKHKGKLTSLRTLYSSRDSIDVTIDELTTDQNDEWILHLRNISKGTRIINNVQPFIIEKNEVLETEVYLKDYYGHAFAHNGTLHEQCFHHEYKSDSLILAENIYNNKLYPLIYQLHQKKIEQLNEGNKVAELINPLIFGSSYILNQNRFAIISSYADLMLIGTYKSENGMYFSSDYYQDGYTKNNYFNHEMRMYCD